MEAQAVAPAWTTVKTLKMLCFQVLYSRIIRRGLDDQA